MPPRHATARRKPCQRCKRRDAVAGERFCPACRSALLREMRNSGYLTPQVRAEVRPASAREDVRQTRDGTDS